MSNIHSTKYFATFLTFPSKYVMSKSTNHQKRLDTHTLRLCNISSLLVNQVDHHGTENRKPNTSNTLDITAQLQTFNKQTLVMILMYYLYRKYIHFNLRLLIDPGDVAIMNSKITIEVKVRHKPFTIKFPITLIYSLFVHVHRKLKCFSVFCKLEYLPCKAFRIILGVWTMKKMLVPKVWAHDRHDDTPQQSTNMPHIKNWHRAY